MRYLIVGNPGSGKTTWARQHLGQAVAYDLDYLSAAFRLSAPHVESHAESKRIANDMLEYLLRAINDSQDIFVIRTCPDLYELDMISPDLVVMMSNQYDISERDDCNNAIMKYDYTALIKWCGENNINVIQGG